MQSLTTSSMHRAALPCTPSGTYLNSGQCLSPAVRPRKRVGHFWCSSTGSSLPQQHKPSTVVPLHSMLLTHPLRTLLQLTPLIARHPLLPSGAALPQPEASLSWERGRLPGSSTPPSLCKTAAEDWRCSAHHCRWADVSVTSCNLSFFMCWQTPRNSVTFSYCTLRTLGVGKQRPATNPSSQRRRFPGP